MSVFWGHWQYKWRFILPILEYQKQIYLNIQCSVLFVFPYQLFAINIEGSASVFVVL